jgi:hypothetical protein
MTADIFNYVTFTPPETILFDELYRLDSIRTVRRSVFILSYLHL